MNKRKHVLFIQGGGNNGYEADAKLVASLEKALGEEYEMHYPAMQTDEAEGDFGWPKQIGQEIDKTGDDVILAAHSLGASMVLKYLSENKITKRIAGIFLLAAPFWSGNDKGIQGLKLRENFAQRLPKDSPLFFYHCRDDKEVPFSHLSTYQHQLPSATFREAKSGGHEFSGQNDLIVNDIKKL